MVVGLSPLPGYKEAEGYTTSDWKWCVGWTLMICEELIGIFLANTQKGELHLGLKKQEIVSVPLWPSAALDYFIIVQ